MDEIVKLVAEDQSAEVIVSTKPKKVLFTKPKVYHRELIKKICDMITKKEILEVSKLVIKTCEQYSDLSTLTKELENHFHMLCEDKYTTFDILPSNILEEVSVQMSNNSEEGGKELENIALDNLEFALSITKVIRGGFISKVPIGSELFKVVSSELLVLELEELMKSNDPTIFEKYSVYKGTLLYNDIYSEEFGLFLQTREGGFKVHTRKFVKRKEK